MSAPELANDRFLRALRRQPVDATPVWLMRQAGRYLPEYRATRKRAGNFMVLCKTPEFACEVTLQPLDRYALDAAIIFSDILTIPDAMGLGLSVEEGVGPVFARPVTTRAEIQALGVPDPGTDLRYVTDAVALTTREIGGRVPLIGFAGSPWTLATYMIEGRGGHDFAKIKGLMLDDPATLHHLLGLLAESCITYLAAQIAAGAHAVMVFDTWGGILPEAAYKEFSARYLEQIVAGLGGAAPTIVFTKGGGVWLEHIAGLGSDAVGLDWTIDIGSARERVGDKVALQGNLDPAILRASPAAIERCACEILESFGPHPGHVFNLGHGITPDIPPEHVTTLIDTVHSFSAGLHARGRVA